MITRLCVVLVLLWLAPSLAPSFAQVAVGGPRKNQNYVGGPTAQKNPVVPDLHRQAATSQSKSAAPKK